MGTSVFPLIVISPSQFLVGSPATHFVARTPPGVESGMKPSSILALHFGHSVGRSGMSFSVGYGHQGLGRGRIDAGPEQHGSREAFSGVIARMTQNRPGGGRRDRGGQPKSKGPGASQGPIAAVVDRSQFA